MCGTSTSIRQSFRAVRMVPEPMFTTRSRRRRAFEQRRRLDADDQSLRLVVAPGWICQTWASEAHRLLRERDPRNSGRLPCREVVGAHELRPPVEALRRGQSRVARCVRRTRCERTVREMRDALFPEVGAIGRRGTPPSSSERRRRAFVTERARLRCWNVYIHPRRLSQPPRAGRE